MAIYFTSDPVGFWDDGIHADIPKSAVNISAARYKELLDGQSTGRAIAADKKGKPVLVEREAPADPVPPVVSRFQARAALHLNGLLEAADAAVQQAEPLVQIAAADAGEWRRDSQMVASIGTALKLSPKKIDDLFRQAATITA